MQSDLWSARHNASCNEFLYANIIFNNLDHTGFAYCELNRISALQVICPSGHSLLVIVSQGVPYCGPLFVFCQFLSSFFL